jgi:hypothetical protein
MEQRQIPRKRTDTLNVVMALTAAAFAAAIAALFGSHD